jgi:hypothetical protein
LLDGSAPPATWRSGYAADCKSRRDACETSNIGKIGTQDIPETEGEPDNRLSAIRGRAIAIRTAWDELTDWEANHFASVVFEELSQGEPIPPFGSLLETARDWARFSAAAELEAYALACLERMAPQRRVAFLTYAQSRAAA